MSAIADASMSRPHCVTAPAPQRRKGQRDTRMSYLLLLPYLVLLIMFGVFPVAYAFGLSFVDTIEMAF